MRIIDKYIFFFGSIYSQWADSLFKEKINDKIIVFNTAEQYMMYCKASLFHDVNIAMEILNTPSPREQKHLGRKVKNFDIEEWDRVKFDIVVRGNELKFGQNQDLYDELMATGDKIIVEASPTDRVWGIGLPEHAPAETLTDESQWRGENLLGKAIMEVRNRFRN